MFDLAWNGKGVYINLSDIPDRVLDLFVEWSNEKITQENEEVERLRGK